MAELFGFDAADIEFGSGFHLQQLNWQVAQGDKWLVAGLNGSGKSALLAAIGGAGRLQSGRINVLRKPIAELSVAVQEALAARERERLEGGMDPSFEDGTPVSVILHELNPDSDLLRELIDRLDLGRHLAQPFLNLSTGETQKALLARALASRHPVLILDEPLKGIDADSVTAASECIERCAGLRTVILVTHRVSVVPRWVEHLAYLESGSIRYQGAMAAPEAADWLEQMSALTMTQLVLPPRVMGQKPLKDPLSPLVVMKNIRVSFGDQSVFDGLNWEINPGEHWQITGPNGSGKTTLLNLITGDSPHCYTNDLNIFGFRRGTGESIWDIKQHIGYMSSGLHLAYRVSASVERVLLSGFFDSIGLYQAASQEQESIVQQWLKLIGLEKNAQQPFSQQSYGNQRLLLITRAMVKQPALLILDEPCLGLDPLNRALVIALIDQLTQSKTTTILYVSHELSDRIHGISKRLSLPLA